MCAISSALLSANIFWSVLFLPSSEASPIEIRPLEVLKLGYRGRYLGKIWLILFPPSILL
jgi:hypothetical protein